MPPRTRVRDRDGGLHADREREQLARRCRAAEHDDDQRLLRADAARRHGQQRRERADDHHEQRVAHACPGCRRPRGTRPPRRRGRPSRAAGGARRSGEVAARRAQDREALAHARGEGLAGGLDATHGEHAREQEDRRDDRRERRVGGRPRPLERGDRRQLGHARQRVLGQREGEDRDAEHDVDERLDEQRRRGSSASSSPPAACA